MNQKDFEQRVARLTHHLGETTKLLKEFDKNFSERAEIKRILKTPEVEIARIREILSRYAYELNEANMREFTDGKEVWEDP